MNIHIISIFPEIFESFLNTSIVRRAVDDEIIQVTTHNPRDFTTDKHQQIDDEIYGGGAGLLMKAQPLIDCLRSLGETMYCSQTKIVCLWPSEIVFNQQIAHNYIKDYDTIVFICGRYEWFDHRFVLWCQQEYDNRFDVVSLWQFVTLWWETPTMVMIESLVRLIPWVISDPESRRDESYRPEQGMSNLEYPQYTRPIEVEGMEVPEVLLSGHHKKIQEWRNDASRKIKKS